jgi:MFS family permease
MRKQRLIIRPPAQAANVTTGDGATKGMKEAYLETTPGDGTQDAAATGLDGDRLLTSSFVLATLTNFFNAFGMQVLFATLPVYVISMGGSHADAGMVSGALALTALLSRPLSGWLADAGRRRSMVLIGTSFYALANVVYLLAGSIPLLVLGRLVHGFGVSCYTTASNAYVVDISPLKRRAEAVGFFAAAQAVGLVIGPVIGFVLLDWSGFRHLFYFTGGLAVAAFSISIFTKERRQPDKIGHQRWTLRTGIVAVDALPVAWMALCMGTGLGAITAFISIFAQSRGLQNPGLYFTVLAVALLISRTFAGRLADQAGRAIVIIPGIVLMVVALAVLPSAHGLPYFVVSAFLFGLGFGAAQPATTALLFDRVRPEQRGLATSTYFTGFDSGFLIGAIPMGLVSQKWGFGLMWSLSAAFTLLSLAGLMAERRRKKP